MKRRLDAANTEGYREVMMLIWLAAMLFIFTFVSAIYAFGGFTEGGSMIALAIFALLVVLLFFSLFMGWKREH